MPLAVQILLLVVAVTAGVYDILYRRIPNWLVLPMWLIAFAVNGMLLGWVGVTQAGLGFGLAMLIYFPLYLLRAMGAGDVKLMAAIGALVGPQNWIAVFLFAAVFGAAGAVFLMIAARRVRRTFLNIASIMSALTRFRAPYKNHEELDVRSTRAFRLPHGAAIALGCIAFTAFGPLFR